METKGQMRARMKQKRDALNQSEVRQLSDRLCAIVKEQSWFTEAETVYFYYPLGKEADILPLAEAALNMGKQVAFPKVNGIAMEFYQIHALSEFSEGTFHVMEPMGQERICRQDALVLVPGLAFDGNGNRMGYGKGYYDRYFARYSMCRKIGISYEQQIISQVICDRYDIPMDALVTEQGVIITKGIREK